MAKWDGSNDDTFIERDDTVHFKYHEALDFF